MNAPKFSFHTFPPIILTPSDLSAEVIIPPPYSPLSHWLIYRLRSPLIMFELSCIIHSQLCCSIRFMSLHGRFSSVLIILQIFTCEHQITVIFHELTSICMQFFLELPMYEIDNEREITLKYKVFISLNYLMLLELSLLQWFFDFLISVHGSNLSLASCSSSVYSSVRWMKMLNKEK